MRSGRQIDQHRETGDDEHCLARALDQTQHDHHGQGVRHGHHRQPHPSQQRADEQQWPPADLVDEAAGERPEHQRGPGEGTEGQACPGLIGADRAGDVERQGVDRDADRGEVDQVGDPQKDERRREETLVGPTVRGTTHPVRLLSAPRRQRVDAVARLVP